MRIVFSTERLVCREFEAKDATDFYQLNLDPEVIRYTGDPPFESVGHAANFIDKYTEYQKYGIGRWAVILKENQRFIGFCGLKYHPDKNIVEVGFRLFKKYWNQGYATESAKGSLAYGFSEKGYSEIYAHVHQDNLASKKVLEKLGMLFQHEAIYEEHPAFVYKIKKDDFIFHS